MDPMNTSQCSLLCSSSSVITLYKQSHIHLLLKTLYSRFLFPPLPRYDQYKANLHRKMEAIQTDVWVEVLVEETLCLVEETVCVYGPCWHGSSEAVSFRQIRRQYRIKNKAAFTLQCKSNGKLNSCLTIYCVSLSYLRRWPSFPQLFMSS